MRALVVLAVVLWGGLAAADSVNSPNITLNVDTNRASGPGAGNVPVTVNTITVAETALPEYTSGDGKVILLRLRDGYAFDPTSPVTARSATIGFNGALIDTDAVLLPVEGVDTLAFVLTSGTDPGVQDIIRINGIKLLIGSAAGAAGPAQTTIRITTATAGGAFSDQGIVAAAITTGAPDRPVFATEPADTQAGAPLLPVVQVVDFGGNVVTNDDRTIVLNLQDDPGDAVLRGINGLPTDAGVATWQASDDLRIDVAADGYTLRASHDGATFLSSDAVVSQPFAITPGAPSALRFVQQPTDVTEGAIVEPPVAVDAVDAFGNAITSFDQDVELSIAAASCGGALLGNVAGAEAGVATFPDLVVEQSCSEAALEATAPGLEGATSERFDVAPAADARPIAASLVQVRPGKVVKVIANGTFVLPNPATDDPTKDGGSLTIEGTIGSVTHVLPASGWKALGSPAGAKGFRFSGGPCPLVVVKAKAIKAVCRPATGTLQVPEPGPVTAVLRVGARTARYCAQCGGASGGTPKGDSAKVFKRTTCRAPAACE
jgi:hypothetical protein